MFSPGMSSAVTTTTSDQSNAGVELDAQQPGVRFRRADRGAVPGPGEDQVVGVLGRPVSFSGPSRRGGAGVARPRAGASAGITSGVVPAVGGRDLVVLLGRSICAC